MIVLVMLKLKRLALLLVLLLSLENLFEACNLMMEERVLN
jgi:hypothetical protein